MDYGWIKDHRIWGLSDSKLTVPWGIRDAIDLPQTLVAEDGLLTGEGFVSFFCWQNSENRLCEMQLISMKPAPRKRKSIYLQTTHFWVPC